MPPQPSEYDDDGGDDLKDSSPSTNYECDPARKEEFDALGSIYADDKIKFQEWGTRLGFRITFAKMKLEIVTDEYYPGKPPIHISVTGLTVPQCIEITSKLTTLAEQKRGTYQLFDLIEETRLLIPADDKGFERPKIELANFSLDALPDAAAAAEYMGKVTLEMITEYLAENRYKVLHTETVLNPRLQVRFEKMWDDFGVKYKDNKRLQEKFIAPEIVFHGTQRKYISNIVARGFVKPGDVMDGGKTTNTIQCGSKYGAGIYTSPDPVKSMCYSDYSDEGFWLEGRKLLVCVCLMGRRYLCEGWSPDHMYSDQCEAGFDSHIGKPNDPNKTPDEYIVFNSAQLLPLYVLHVNYDPAPGEPGPRNWQAWMAGWLRRRRRYCTGVDEIDYSYTNLTLAMKRKILTKVATKHFPLGFGPAVGNKFVVEEIAPVDDDDEEWGEYQMDRQAFVRNGPGTAYLDAEEEEEVLAIDSRDEFQKARSVGYLYKH